MVRIATLDDLGLFRSLWGKFLKEVHDTFGNEIVPSERNLDHFDNLLASYVSDEEDSLKGFALLHDDHSVLLWGQSGSPFETWYDPYLFGWGTYVDPGHRGQGVSKALRSRAVEESKRLGFHTILGSASIENEASIAGWYSLGGVMLDTRVGLMRI